MTEQPMPRRPFLRRLFTTADGLVAIIAIMSSTVIATATATRWLDDRVDQAEAMPLEVAALDQRISEQAGRITTLEKGGSFTAEERAELQATTQKTAKLVDYLFCRTAPPEEVQLFAGTDCPQPEGI